MPDSPLNKLQFNDLIVQLAQLLKEGAGASPGAPNSAKIDPTLDELLPLMARRGHAAKAISEAVKTCAASTEMAPRVAPVDLTDIQMCVQEQTSSFGAPRGILVVRHLFRAL